MFHLSVLGAPVLVGPSGPVTGRAAYRRRIALLSLLAVSRGRPVGRERVIGLLWPEHPADAARHSLSESLYVLRKELGDDAFLSSGDDLGLSPEAVRTDVGAFSEALEAGRLEDAVAAYGGPFMDGFYVSAASEFEHWVDAERDRLSRAYARALDTLAARAEAEGRTLEAAEWWRRLAAHDPCSARVVLRLAAALETAGERAAALRALAVHEARLRTDLGMEPEPEVRALERRLRAVPPAAAPSPSPPPSPPDPLPGSAAGEAPAPAAGPAPTPRPDSAPRAVRPPPPRWRSAAMWAALLLLLAGAALVPSFPLREARLPAERYDPRRIAILYFEAPPPDDDLGYLAAGLTGELIDQLSGVAALEVVPRAGVRGYRDGEVGFDSLVAGLRVGSVVEGSVQRAGDSVRVTVRLVDTNRQVQLESRTLVRPAGEVLALQRSVGDEVTGFLRRRLGREVRLRQAAAETRSGEALALVFRAEAAREAAQRMARRSHPLDRASTLARLAEADSLLHAAHAADPAWARPPVLLGNVALARAALVAGPARAAQEAAAERHAARALARAPGHPGALALRGRTALRRALREGGGTPDPVHLDRAERDLRAAVEADEAMASAWASLSQLLRLRGRTAESEEAARRALAADAYLEDADAILARLYFGAMTQGDHTDARGWCEEGHARFPADWRFVECRLTLAREDPSAPPSPAQAWALAAELARLDPPSRAREEGRSSSQGYRLASVAAVLARAGLPDSARAVLARARREAEGDPEGRISFLFDEAYVALLLGDRAGARRLLDDYLAARPALRPYLTRDAAFRGLLTP